MQTYFELKKTNTCKTYYCKLTKKIFFKSAICFYFDVILFIFHVGKKERKTRMVKTFYCGIFKASKIFRSIPTRLPIKLTNSITLTLKTGKIDHPIRAITPNSVPSGSPTLVQSSEESESSPIYTFVETVM